MPPAVAISEVMDPLISLAAGAVLKFIALSYVGISHRKLFQKIGTVADIYIYPVKSCGVTAVTKAECTPVGLDADGLADRHWMILDDRQKILTMKEEPRLTLIKCSSLDGCILLTAPGMEILKLLKKPDLKKSKLQVNVFCKQPVITVHCGDEAKTWISKFLGQPASIVFSSTELGARDVYDRARKWPNNSRKGDSTIFAYLTSYMVSTTGSLDQINSQLAPPVSMVNFRPNIVVQSSVPFDEDTWTDVMIGDRVLFHTVEPCRRCTITTIDPDSGKSRGDRQPLELLKTSRCKKPYGAAPLFGVYLSLDTPGHIQVGDHVSVIKTDSARFQSNSVSHF
ncbi:Mitochondrial amidoxime-reducing component 1 [Bulinus truncatus]|nr:Mitochondrial amidoxime-reducing component 1 [Bulinus truncatus]